LIDALPNKWLLAVRPDWIGLVPACDSSVEWREENNKKKNNQEGAGSELDEA